MLYVDKWNGNDEVGGGPYCHGGSWIDEGFEFAWGNEFGKVSVIFLHINININIILKMIIPVSYLALHVIRMISWLKWLWRMLLRFSRMWICFPDWNLKLNLPTCISNRRLCSIIRLQYTSIGLLFLYKYDSKHSIENHSSLLVPKTCSSWIDDIPHS